MYKKLLVTIIVMICLILSTIGIACAESGNAYDLPLPFIILVAVLSPCLIGLIIFFVIVCKRYKKKQAKQKENIKIIRIND